MRHPIQILGLLARIGDDLDRDVMPVVFEDGVVLPGASRSLRSMPGKGTANHAQSETAGSEGSEAGPGQRAARRDPATGSRAPGAKALVLGQPGLTDRTRDDLLGAIAGYPRMRLRFVPSGAFLSTWIRPIDRLEAALMLTYYPWDTTDRLPTWCWWDAGVWIGPRHTNFGDGSVCAFEPTHGTWNRSQPLWRLFDLTTVWVVRHLHLRHIGRWPGRQILHTVHERLTDGLPGELCGCGSDARYRECCLSSDRSTPALDRLREFRAKYPDPVRRPPSCVLRGARLPGAPQPR